MVSKLALGHHQPHTRKGKGKRGQVPLSAGEIELYTRQDEAAQRRQRLLEVRAQERRIAQQVTRRYRENLDRMRGKRSKETLVEWTLRQEVLLTELHERYQRSLQGMGSAQRNARDKLLELLEDANEEALKWRFNGEVVGKHRSGHAIRLHEEQEKARLARRWEVQHNLTRLRDLAAQQRREASEHATKEREAQAKAKQDSAVAERLRQENAVEEVVTMRRPHESDVSAYRFTRTHCLPPYRPQSGSHSRPDVTVIRHNTRHPTAMNGIDEAVVYLDEVDKQLEHKRAVKAQNDSVADDRGADALNVLKSREEGDKAMEWLASVDKIERQAHSAEDRGDHPIGAPTGRMDRTHAEKAFARLFEIDEEDSGELSVFSVGSDEEQMGEKFSPSRLVAADIEKDRLRVAKPFDTDSQVDALDSDFNKSVQRPKTIGKDDELGQEQSQKYTKDLADLGKPSELNEPTNEAAEVKEIRRPKDERQRKSSDAFVSDRTQTHAELAEPLGKELAEDIDHDGQLDAAISNSRSQRLDAVMPTRVGGMSRYGGNGTEPHSSILVEEIDAVDIDDESDENSITELENQLQQVLNLRMKRPRQGLPSHRRLSTSILSDTSADIDTHMDHVDAGKPSTERFQTDGEFKELLGEIVGKPDDGIRQRTSVAGTSGVVDEYEVGDLDQSDRSSLSRSILSGTSAGFDKHMDHVDAGKPYTQRFGTDEDFEGVRGDSITRPSKARHDDRTSGRASVVGISEVVDEYEVGDLDRSDRSALSRSILSDTSADFDTHLDRFDAGKPSTEHFGTNGDFGQLRNEPVGKHDDRTRARAPVVGFSEAVDEYEVGDLEQSDRSALSRSIPSDTRSAIDAHMDHVDAGKPSTWAIRTGGDFGELLGEPLGKQDDHIRGRASVVGVSEAVDEYEVGDLDRSDRSALSRSILSDTSAAIDDRHIRSNYDARIGERDISFLSPISSSSSEYAVPDTAEFRQSGKYASPIPTSGDAYLRQMALRSRRRSAGASSLVQYSLPASDSQSSFDDSLDSSRLLGNDSFVNKLVPMFVRGRQESPGADMDEDSREYAVQLEEPRLGRMERATLHISEGDHKSNEPGPQPRTTLESRSRNDLEGRELGATGLTRPDRVNTSDMLDASVGRAQQQASSAARAEPDVSLLQYSLAEDHDASVDSEMLSDGGSSRSSIGFAVQLALATGTRRKLLRDEYGGQISRVAPMQTDSAGISNLEKQNILNRSTSSLSETGNLNDDGDEAPKSRYSSDSSFSIDNHFNYLVDMASAAQEAIPLSIYLPARVFGDTDMSKPPAPMAHLQALLASPESTPSSAISTSPKFPHSKMEGRSSGSSDNNLELLERHSGSEHDEFIASHQGSRLSSPKQSGSERSFGSVRSSDAGSMDSETTEHLAAKFRSVPPPPLNNIDMTQPPAPVVGNFRSHSSSRASLQGDEPADALLKRDIDDESNYSHSFDGFDEELKHQSSSSYSDSSSLSGSEGQHPPSAQIAAGADTSGGAGISLSEAFKRRHPGFHKRAKQRQQELESRQRDQPPRKQHDETQRKDQEDVSDRSSDRSSPGPRTGDVARSTSPLRKEQQTLLDRLASGGRAKVPDQEMKQRSRRLYQQLPEVVERRRQEEVLRRRRERLDQLREQEKVRHQLAKAASTQTNHSAS